MMALYHIAKLGMLIGFGTLFIIFAYAQWGQKKKEEEFENPANDPLFIQQVGDRRRRWPKGMEHCLKVNEYTETSDGKCHYYQNK